MFDLKTKYFYIVLIDDIVVSTQESPVEIIHPDLLEVDELPVVGQRKVGDKFENFVAEIIEKRIVSITKGWFRSRFTFTEKIGIEQAALVDIEVKVIEKDFDNSFFINVDDTELQQGLALYVQKGLLTAKRVGEVLKDGLPHEAF